MVMVAWTAMDSGHARTASAAESSSNLASHLAEPTRAVAPAAPPTADRQRLGQIRIVTARWVAIAGQRHDVLDLTRADVLRILTGRVRDWSELGGSPMPIVVYLPRSQIGLIVNALGFFVAELAVELIADDELVERIALTPGAFALVQPEELRVGVLALTVDGHDPYRDPAHESPLRSVVRLPTGHDLASRFREALRTGATRPFDPVGVLITGELLPVRCTNHVLAALDDYDAMFDGVRDAIRAADLAVAPLELPLTDVGEPTPCVTTVSFTGSPRAVTAMANAGIDVVLTIGNHMMDCWDGCSGPDALSDTLARLRNEGMSTAGAGESLAAARTPAVVGVQSGRTAVHFAFLGYDIIAPWYWAEDDQPGTAPLKAEFIREDVQAARQIADHVLVGVNWGIEYTANPVAYQRELAKIALDAGATVLFGNHPHWVQAVEHLDAALVAYSFGNFVFDQAWSVPTTQGMLMELGFTADRLLGYRIRPVVIRSHSRDLPWIYRPEFVDPAAEGRPIMDRIWNATDRLPERPAAAATIAKSKD